MERCARCVIPTSVRGVVLDENGVCNFCRLYVPDELQAEQELYQLMETARRSHAKWDAVVPLSGGRDSSFVLYLAKVVHKLNVVAVNFHNDFQSEQAKQNIQRACEKLDVPCITVKSRFGLPKRIVRSQIRACMPLGLFSIVGKVCFACSYGYHAAVFRTAAKYNIPLILWGASKAEETRTVGALAFADRVYSSPSKLLKPAWYWAEFYTLLQRLELRVPGHRLWNRRVPQLRQEGIREVFMFDYVRWEREHMKAIIKSELGWEKPAGHLSTWRMDCRLHPFINFAYVRMIGCTKDCIGYCGMIHQGQMTRAEALAQEEDMLQSLESEMPRLLKDIGLSSREIKRLMQMEQPKSQPDVALGTPETTTPRGKSASMMMWLLAHLIGWSAMLPGISDSYGLLLSC